MEDNSKVKILVIEDQEDIRDLIRLQLKLNSYNVSTAENIKTGQELLENSTYDLFLIDRMLPDGTGVDMCKFIREKDKYSQTPIIFVTALSEPENIIEGLDAGADDYITKPFDINILQARVRANIRRFAKPQKSDRLIFGGIELNTVKCNVKIHGEKITLTNTEFQILSLLMQEPGVVHSRKELIRKILGEEVFVTNRIIDTHIVGLRKKIKSEAKYIETIRGVGYRFMEDE